jgi:hypothetical protein
MKNFPQSRNDKKAVNLFSLKYLFAPFIIFLVPLRETGWWNISHKAEMIKKPQSCFA